MRGRALALSGALRRFLVRCASEYKPQYKTTRFGHGLSEPLEVGLIEFGQKVAFRNPLEVGLIEFGQKVAPSGANSSTK